jgi:hypothetical protein
VQCIEKITQCVRLGVGRVCKLLAGEVGIGHVHPHDRLGDQAVPSFIGAPSSDRLCWPARGTEGP